MNRRRAQATSKLIVMLVVGLVIGFGATYAYYASAPAGVTKTVTKTETTTKTVTAVGAAKEYTIGFTIPLTGELTAIGTNWKNTIEMAMEDLNEDVASYGLNVKFKAVVLDDKTTPEGALKNVQTLYQSGIKVIIGPAASAQVKAIKSFVDENHVVIISPSSTAPTLAIPDDYIFRTVGSDAIQARALATLAYEQGVRKVVVFHRDDEYGVAFGNFFKKYFEEMGGTAVDMKYAVGLPDYASEVAQLSAKVKEIGADGIVIITFDTDGANILSHAKDDPVLCSVRWFSAEGIHGTPELTKPEIVEFINKTGFYGTRPLFRENPIYKQFASRFEERYGIKPVVFTSNLYDAVQLAGWAILKAEEYDGAAIKEVVPEVAMRHYGASGWCILDEAGDKLMQDYAIWTVGSTPTGYDYVDVASYSGGTISWG